MALTRITKGVIKPNENYDTHNINSTGIVTAIGLDVNGNGDISGNLSVGGVLTYEDVTSIDSVGIITAQSDIHVGGGVSAIGVGTFSGLDISGDIDVDGHTNLDNVNIAGVTTMSGNLTIYNADPQLTFRDTNHSPYFYYLKGRLGAFVIEDSVNGDRISFNASGSTSFGGGVVVVPSLQVSSNVGVVGNINLGSSIIHDGDTDTKIHFPANDTIRFETAGSQRLNINSSGNVSITNDLDVDGHTNLDNVSIAGVTTISGNLYAEGNSIEIKGTMPYLALTDTNSNPDYSLFNSNGVFSIYDGTNSANRLTISSSGNVGILQDLDVDGHTNLDNVSIAGIATVTGHLNQQYGGIVSKIGYISGGAEAYYGTTSNHALFIGTAGSNRIKISNTSAATSIGGSMVFNAMLTVQGDVSGAIFQLKAAENTNRLMVAGSNTNGVEINLYDDTGGQRGILGVSGTEFFIKAPNNSAPMTFYTHNGSSIGERLRINVNGDVTTTGQASFSRQNAGFTARAGDAVSITRASGTPLEINRTGSDGQMISLMDDNTQEAAISISGGALQFGTPNGSNPRLAITSGGTVNIGGDYTNTTGKLKVTGVVTVDGGFNLTAGSLTAPGGFSINSGNVIISGDIAHDADSDTKFGFSSGADTFRIDTAGSRRIYVDSSGRTNISKNGYTGSDMTFGLTVHTGATSETGPVNDGIMIVSQQNNGNQNSTTGKLMFCGHAQTNGPFLYGDSEQAYGKKGLVFHTHSTANSYSTQLEETARFTHGGFFGLGTGTAVDSLMHIQGNSDSGGEQCQLTIEDEDTTAGSRVPSIQFKGNGANTWQIRGTDLSGLQFRSWNGSSQIERSTIGNPSEGGAFLLNADDRGWATFRHNHNQGLRTHIRRHYSPGNAVATYDIMRIRRYWWGWGTYKITCRSLYYNSSLESVYYINGHLSGGNHISIAKQTFGGDASNQDWSCTVTHTASNNAPGGGSPDVWYADIKVNIPNYYYVTIIIEAFSSQYSTDPSNMGIDSYCLM